MSDNFSDNINNAGEGVISENLKSLINGGGAGHAMLFEGKNALLNADYYAKAMVCAGQVRPCGECVACKKADERNHPDIIYLEPDKPSNPYPVDVIRSIRSDAIVMPNEAKQKVYIFTKADNISVTSQNALLKILEEPPEFVCFAICCDKKEMLLDTIISRVTEISCGAANAPEIDEETLEKCREIIKTTLSGREYDLIKATVSLSSKDSFEKVLFGLKSIIRELYLIKSGVRNDEFSDFSKQISPKITLKVAMRLNDTVDDTLQNIAANANMQLNLTRFCSKMKQSAGQ